MKPSSTLNSLQKKPACRIRISLICIFVIASRITANWRYPGHRRLENNSLLSIVIFIGHGFFYLSQSTQRPQRLKNRCQGSGTKNGGPAFVDTDDRINRISRIFLFFLQSKELIEERKSSLRERGQGAGSWFRVSGKKTRSKLRPN